MEALPIAEGFRSPAKVLRHIEHLSGDHLHQFGLRRFDLKMKAAEGVFAGEREIVPEQTPYQCGGRITFEIICFSEKAAVVSEHFGSTIKRPFSAVVMIFMMPSFRIKNIHQVLAISVFLKRTGKRFYLLCRKYILCDRQFLQGRPPSTPVVFQ